MTTFRIMTSYVYTNSSLPTNSLFKKEILPKGGMLLLLLIINELD
jgi:hypothetical protein